jgi:hypothetical protein
MESQHLAITRQWHVNNRGIVFSEQSELMAAHTIMEDAMPLLNNNCTGCPDVINSAS